VARRLVLASNSPRRRELLSAAGFIFDTVGPKTEECSDINLTVRELTAFNALRKGMVVAGAYPNRIVLSADTLVSFDNQVIGKPRNHDGAVKILRLLSGKVHEVCSSVFILDLAGARSVMFHELSQVRFHRLSGRKIEEYLAKVNPLDKAGAYAAQGYGVEIIASIKGSYTNVVGLPMEKTTAALASFGLIQTRKASKIKR
jgi:septum formation protein